MNFTRQDFLDQIKVKVLARTSAPARPEVLTVQLTLPRVILAELNTHRMISKSVASSRAVPYSKLKSRIEANPYMPWPQKNKKGMQSIEDYTEEERQLFWEKHLKQLQVTLDYCDDLISSLNPHKQFVNRYLEPWMMVDAICTATDWTNFLALRDHEAAEPAFQVLANKVHKAYLEYPATPGKWHLPLMTNLPPDIQRETDRQIAEIAERQNIEGDPENLKALASAGRCASISYFNHESGKVDVAADIDRAYKLMFHKPGHMSPFEHVCTSEFELWRLNNHGYCKNLYHWVSYRAFIADENITNLRDYPYTELR